MSRRRKALLGAAAVVVVVIAGNSVLNRASCAYYGYQTDREVRYAAFVGCMVSRPSGWVLRSELRAVQ